MALNQYLHALRQIQQDTREAAQRAQREGYPDDAAELVEAADRLATVMDIFIRNGR